MKISLVHFFFTEFIIRIFYYFSHDPENKSIRAGWKTDYPMDEKRWEIIKIQTDRLSFISNQLNIH